jgi:hypothetical protein
MVYSSISGLIKFYKIGNFVGTWGGYPPAENMNLDPPGSTGTGDPDLQVKFPMSIPTSILATTHRLALLMSSLSRGKQSESWG